MLFALILASLGVRLGLALAHNGYLGVDGGAYLLSYKAVTGSGVPNTDFARPPFAPGLLMAPFVIPFGMDVGLKLFTSTTSLVIVAPFWLLARRFLSPWWAVAAVAWLLIDVMLAEMMVTGSLPIIGWSFTVLAMWAVFRLMDNYQNGTTTAYWGLALSIPLIALTNQTAAGITLIVFPVFLIAVRLTHPQGAWMFNRVAHPLLAGGVMSLAALPWYIGVAPGSGGLRYGGSLLALFSPYSPVWGQVMGWGLVGLLTWKFAKGELRALGAVVIAMALLMPWASSDESIQNVLYRPRYLVAAPGYVCVAWLTAIGIRRLRSEMKGLLAAFGLFFFAWVSAGWVFQVVNQSAISEMVSPETARALTLIDGPGNVLTNSASMSWYVSALTGRETRHAFAEEPPADYQQWHQDAICVLGWVECDVPAAVNRLGVQYVLVDTRWPNGTYSAIWQAPNQPWRTTQEKATWLEAIYAGKATLLWRVSLPRSSFFP